MDPRALFCLDCVLKEELIGKRQASVMRRVRSWIQDHPRPLEWAYRITEQLFQFLSPFFARVGYSRVARIILPLEKLSKKLAFDCRMCGQCILRLTGMTCPMTCPKKLRNGPCGGVRPGGYCEVYPERRCIWTDAYERSRKMHFYGGGILDVHPPVDWRLEGTSAWINMLTGTDQQTPAEKQRVKAPTLPGELSSRRS